jgi:hypothetical protein
MRASGLPCLVLGIVFLATTGLAATLDLSTAQLSIDEHGVVTAIRFADGTPWSSTGQAAFGIVAGGRWHAPESVRAEGNRWTVRFDNGTIAEFRVTCQRGFALFRLSKLESRETITWLQLFRVLVPGDAQVADMLNAATHGKQFVAVMPVEPNVCTAPLVQQGKLGLTAETMTQHGIEPAAFGVIACPAAERLDTIERLELASGMPSPHPGGVWSKRSPWTKESYFFLTFFRESQFDEAIRIARRGGFSTILLWQNSWTKSTGHYEVNRDCFPDGLPGLKRTVQRFKDAGFRVGFHVLAASIDASDPYITPVPDRRLVTGTTGRLAADIDAKATFLPLEAAPKDFPAKDDGYTGAGTVLRIGDELIAYGRRTLQAPFGFADCARGHLGTKPVVHRKGEPVRHLVRAYGYHMHDMDTTLLDEVAGHFADVANACGIDMIYFDGSEALQGDQWYYAARLHKAFYDKLQNKNMFMQASSFSPYSWHLLSRSASADGHDDLKGYLDERSPVFDGLRRLFLPLDIGWYYGYDPNATLDQFEYILGATIGYDSSMSFQDACEAAAGHPFTGAILDLIARYEKLRLSGRVSKAMRQRLRVDPVLATTTEKQATLLDHRREYRLLGEPGREYFQRVVYAPWHEVRSLDAKQTTWGMQVGQPQTRVGVQIHVPTGANPESRTVVDPFVEIDGRRWQWKGPLEANQYVYFWPDEPVTRYRASKEPELLAQKAASVVLPVGEHTVRFGCRGTLPAPVRVRVTLQPAERHEIAAGN